MGKEVVLPKNIRQIGDIQGKEKVCMEDYVMTYIRKKEPQEDTGFLGIFLGERKETEEAAYTFIRGILEVPDETEREKLQEQFEKQKMEYFPGWEVMGCCVIGTYPTKKMELVAAALPGCRRLIYHLQEQEETLHLLTGETYKKAGGYLVFYEQNRKMQDYLADVFGENSVEKESLPDKAIKSFREKVKEKGEQKTHSVLKLASSFFVVTVLAIGVIVVNRVDAVRSTGSTSILTEETSAASGKNTVLRYEVQQEGEGSSTDLYTQADSYTASQSENADRTTTVQVQEAGSTATVTDNTDQSTTVLQAGSTAAIPAETDENATAQEAGSTATAADNTDQNTVLQNESSVTVSADTDQTAAVQAQEADSTAADVLSASGESTASLAGSDAFWETAEDDGTQSESTEASSRQIQSAYVIKEGDTLANICQKYYGSIERLEEICEANNITDANVILPGQKIVLP